jgi:hypothetical protein
LKDKSGSPRSSQGRAFFGPDIEQQIAEALMLRGAFSARLYANELDLIFANILIALVARQKLYGREVLVQSEVIRIDISIDNEGMRVHSAARILHPIAAELEFNYTLENDGLSAQPNLRLKNKAVHVVERTGPFDFVAKMALGAVDVKQIALHELSDPAQIIKKTLPPRLRLYGFNGSLSEVGLHLQPDNTLAVQISA